MRKRIEYIFLTALLLFLNVSANAQGCAACKATGEQSNGDSGSNLADGLNSGIIVLMVIPYILLFILFRKRIVKVYKEFTSMKR